MQLQLDMLAPLALPAADPCFLTLMRLQKWKHAPATEIPLVRIELIPHEGCWMWSASLDSDTCAAQGYRALPKWGKFAESRRLALENAVEEVLAFAHRASESEQERISAWLGCLLAEASTGGFKGDASH